MKCRACDTVLKNIPVTFDAFSFLQGIKEMYCPNEECQWYGVVTVAGKSEEVK